MKKQHTVIINDVAYDAQTGLRAEPRHTADRQSQSSHVIHTRAQRSQTLNRRVASKSTARKPIAVTASAQAIHRQHPQVKKFADIAPARKARAVRSMDIGPVTHPHVAKAHQQVAQQKATPAPAHGASLSAQQIKQHVVSDSLKKAPSHAANHKPIRTKTRHFPRIMSVASAGLAVLLLAGYFTYLNMPNLSVRVAAAQAGIDASYPNYRPDGYSLSGAVAYNSGQVSMKFASNSGPQKFTVTQSHTDWDSSVVEQNYVEQKWGSKTDTVIDHGLTIYTHDGEAAWVNGGILYEIQGDAPLSTTQLTRIATSL